MWGEGVRGGCEGMDISVDGCMYVCMYKMVHELYICLMHFFFFFPLSFDHLINPSLSSSRVGQTKCHLYSPFTFTPSTPRTDS